MYLQMVYTNTSFICYPSVVVFRRKFIPADTHKRSKRKAKQGKTKTFRDPALLSSNPRQLLPLSPDPHSPQHYTLAVDLARNLADRKKQHEHIHTHFQIPSFDSSRDGVGPLAGRQESKRTKERTTKRRDCRRTSLYCEIFRAGKQADTPNPSEGKETRSGEDSRQPRPLRLALSSPPTPLPSATPPPPVSPCLRR